MAMMQPKVSDSTEGSVFMDDDDVTNNGHWYESKQTSAEQEALEAVRQVEVDVEKNKQTLQSHKTQLEHHEFKLGALTNQAPQKVQTPKPTKVSNTNEKQPSFNITSWM